MASSSKSESFAGRRRGPRLLSGLAGLKLALWIALRHLLCADNRYVRLVNWVSLLGLGVGVLVLTVVVSVMNGFDAELRTRILGTVPHAVLPGAVADPAAVAAMPGVLTAYRFFEASGMLASAKAVAPVAVYGLDPDGGTASAGASPLAGIGAQMLDIGLAEALRQPAGLVMGLPLARQLGLSLGDEARLVVPEGFQGAVRPHFKRYRLSGLFALGAEFDYGLVVVRRSSFSAQERRVLGADGVRVVLEDPLEAERFADHWRGRRNDGAAALWTERYGELFQAVRVEKALMFLILLLVVAVAGFNIVAGQTMVIDGKRADIAVLRTLGATGALVRRVFLLQGLAVASVGIVAGLLLGVLAAFNAGAAIAQVESWLNFSLLEGSYFDSVPSRVEAADLALIGGASWLLCLLAAWLPARRAAEQAPIKGLHLP